MDRCDMGITVVRINSVHLIQLKSVNILAYYEVQLKIKLLTFMS